MTRNQRTALFAHDAAVRARRSYWSGVGIGIVIGSVVTAILVATTLAL